MFIQDENYGKYFCILPCKRFAHVQGIVLNIHKWYCQKRARERERELYKKSLRYEWLNIIYVCVCVCECEYEWVYQWKCIWFNLNWLNAST